ncbi:hypothetical protein HQ393_13410 [Chitinibacter bivalviorum]|uniref:Lipocalin-like domain-containing protein n=1 Tax=Chitinibacter bivalviorum TaxID=2739434 RepID=A0A7H9BKG7_9NEIS|nr:hypothetical protein [Chitinibacter bivalviorum]QLG89160.1 hypothetical protein HQ393_13410 [Chitinibacter bivalviorum]
MNSNPFIGAWQLVSGEIAEPGEAIKPYNMNELQSRKVISAQSFSFVTLLRGAFYSAASGGYRFDQTSYTETPALASWGEMNGAEFTFTYRIAGDEWHNERFNAAGERVEYEIWRRVSA